jgi:hypothetical protein
MNEWVTDRERSQLITVDEIVKLLQDNFRILLDLLDRLPTFLPISVLLVISPEMFYCTGRISCFGLPFTAHLVDSIKG